MGLLATALSGETACDCYTNDLETPSRSSLVSSRLPHCIAFKYQPAHLQQIPLHMLQAVIRQSAAEGHGIVQMLAHLPILMQGCRVRDVLGAKFCQASCKGCRIDTSLDRKSSALHRMQALCTQSCGMVQPRIWRCWECLLHKMIVGHAPRACSTSSQPQHLT